MPAGLVPVPPTGCSATSDGVSCAVGTVAAGSSGIIEIPVQVVTGLPGGTALTDVATISSDQIDPDATNNEVSFTSTVRRALNAVVTIAADRDRTTPGGPPSYRVTVSNEGPIAATGVVVTVTLPEDLVVATLLPAGITPLAFEDAACTMSGSTLTCPVGELAVGETSSMDVTGSVRPGTALGTELVATARVTVAEVDIDPSDDVDIDAIVIAAVVSVGPLPFTGAQVLGLVSVALLLIAAGTALAISARARSRAIDS